MPELRFTLLTDGSSDDALLHVISWLLRRHLDDWAINGQWADLRRLANPPRGLTGRVTKALEYYPCDVLFIHRDAEREPPEHRMAEIRRAMGTVGGIPTCICVVPVRMTEAWLLFDEPAIRRAASNPNGQMALELPLLDRVEELPDPKETLKALLRQASGLHGRRLKSFKPAPRWVASLITDFAPLARCLPFSVSKAMWRPSPPGYEQAPDDVSFRSGVQNER